MNSYNQSAIFPQRLMALNISIVLTLGIHHSYFSDMALSLPIFLSLLTTMSLQLTSIITAPIFYATPKGSPIELFLNYKNNQSSYEELLNNPANTPQSDAQPNNESLNLNIWANESLEHNAQITQ